MLTYFPQIVFVILSLMILMPFVPLRWSIFAYLLIAHISLPKEGFETATSLGIENAIKTILFPSILLIRIILAEKTQFLGWLRYLARCNQLILKVWLLFFLYVIAAALWSPYPLPSVKLIGYLYSYTVGIPLFIYLFLQEENKVHKTILVSVLVAVGLALFKTFIFSGLNTGEDRLTAFTSNQGFGLYLALMFVLIILGVKDNARQVISSMIVAGVLLVAVLLNGSRISLFAIGLITVASFLIGMLLLTNKQPLLISSSFLTAIVLASFLYIYYSGFNTNLVHSRIFEVQTLFSDSSSIQDIGTARFRIQMYQTVIDLVRSQSWQQTVFGNGTSSAATLITFGYIRYRNYDEYTVDANRTIHNEYLRALYEWGVVGAALFLLFILMLCRSAILLALQTRKFDAYMSTVAILVICLFMFTENILAAANLPVGMAIALVIARQFTKSLTDAPIVIPM